MFVHDLFLDPTLRLVCNAEGDNPPEGGAGGDPPKPPGDTPTPKDAAGDAPKPPDAPPAGDQPPDPGWTKEALEKQVARQHRKIKELEEQAKRAVELEGENLRLQDLAKAATRRAEPPADPNAGGERPPSPPPPAPAPPVAQDRKALLEQARFDVQVEALTETIRGQYAADWPAAYENYTKVGGLTNDLMAQILATDDPAYVTIALGKDPSKLQDVLDMSGPKRQAALIKMAMEKVAKPAEPPKRPSGAPPPPSGEHQRGAAAQPSGSVDLYDDKLAGEDADATWYAERMRQKRESKGRPWSTTR